jgi:hypothetical protein
MAIPLQSVMRAPVAVGLGQAALAGGLSAYGNVAEENDRSKGDQRMILESALAALGAGVAAAKMRGVMNRQAAPLAARIDAHLQARHPAARQSIKSAYQGNELLRRIPPETLLGLTGTSAAAALGAGVLGGAVAPFAADQLGLLQAPGSWTRRAHDWNWDRQIQMEEAIAQAVTQRLAEMGAS